MNQETLNYFRNELRTTRAELARYRGREERLLSAIETFRRDAGKHDGDHDSNLTVCAACDSSYIWAEAELDRVLAAIRKGVEG